MATAQRHVGERVAKAAGGLGVVSETGHVVRSHGTHVDEAVHSDDYDCFHGTHTNNNVLFLEPSKYVVCKDEYACAGKCTFRSV